MISSGKKIFFVVTRWMKAQDDVYNALKGRKVGEHWLKNQKIMEAFKEFKLATFDCVERKVCGWCNRKVNEEELSQIDLVEYRQSAICPACEGEEAKLKQIGVSIN